MGLSRRLPIVAPALLSWMSHRAQRLLVKSNHAIAGFSNEGLSPEELEEFTLWCYRHNYHSSLGRSETLFEWEEELWNTYLQDCDRVLVLAAGRGREVAQLEKRGHDVWATEPDLEALKSCRQSSLHPEQMSEVDFRAFARLGTQSWSAQVCPPTFDAVIVGWGSLSHCFGEKLRSDLFGMIGDLCPEGPILSSFWYMRNNNRRAQGGSYQVGAKLGQLVRKLRKAESGEPLQSAFANHMGLALLFTSSELTRLADIVDRDLAVPPAPEASYPYAVMVSCPKHN